MKKEFLVALHALNPTQIQKQAEIILGGYADGFLIVNNNNHMNGGQILDIASDLKKQFPSATIGINALDLSIAEAMKKIVLCKKSIDILWTDGSGLIENDGNLHPNPIISKQLHAFRCTGTKWYGGAAFKYRVHRSEPGKFAKIVSLYVDAVITSGNKTGSPANLEKAIEISSAVGKSKPVV